MNKTAKSAFAKVQDWNSLLNNEPLAKEGKSQNVGDVRASSVGKFRRYLRRFAQKGFDFCG
jgi:hypothetical protein